MLLTPDHSPAGNATVLRRAFASGDEHLRSVSAREQSHTSDSLAELGAVRRGGGTVRTAAHAVNSGAGADSGHEVSEDEGLGVHTLEGLLSGAQAQSTSGAQTQSTSGVQTEQLTSNAHATTTVTTTAVTTGMTTTTVTTVAAAGGTTVTGMVASTGQGPLVAQAMHALSLQSLARQAAIAAEQATIEAVALANASVLAHEEAWLQRGVANQTRATADVAADLAVKATNNATKWDGYALLEEGNATQEENQASSAATAADAAAAVAAAKAQFALEKSIAANSSTSHR